MAQGKRQAPVYLARKSYRQRRLRDAARMLPVLGLILWLLPLAGSVSGTAATGVYIFGVWIVLILLAAMLARRISDETDDEAAPGRDPTAR